MRNVSSSHHSLRYWIPITLLSVGVILVNPERKASQEPAPANSPQASPQKIADENPPECPEAETLRKDIQKLKLEIQYLKRKTTTLENAQRASVLQEQLEREEQRGENLQLHLIEIGEKEEPLRACLAQIEQDLKPKNLEQGLSGVGTVHPEDLREDVRILLNNTRLRILGQLSLWQQDRIRTQSMLATTDAAIRRLKQLLAEALR